MTLINIRNIVTRAAWTALQSFLGYLSADALVESVGIPEAWKLVLTAAIATALSVAKTYVAEKLNPTVTLPAEAVVAVVPAEPADPETGN